MTIEQDIKQFRINKGMTISKFADEIGVHVETISKIENGKIKAGNNTLDKINAYFGTDFKVELKCPSCQNVFKPYNSHQLFCDECISKRKKYEYPKQDKQPKQSVTDFDAEAKSRGMNYGELQQAEYKRLHPMVRIKDLRRA